jgi:light-regulated signal transduction histidine kinase (bacteriophytochrome)
MNLRVPQVQLANSEWGDEGDCLVPLNAASLHDLVGPANQMRSMADLLLTRYREKVDDDSAVLLGFIQDSSNRLQNLLTGLRTYTKIVGQRQPHRYFSANEVLAGALGTLQPAIEQSDALISHDPLPDLYGDPNQICYVFSSLIENSIKFRSENRPQVHVTAIQEENDWLFSVSDNGIGIDPRHRDSIFGVFKRVHNDAYPGAGMGLAVTHRIVERHGGRIWVESGAGYGATFLFSLPGKPRAAPDGP